MTAYKEIRAALETNLNSIENIPDLAWQNTSYRPTTSQPWIMPRLLFTSRQPSVAGLNPNTNKPHLQRYQGVLQLILNYPENSGSSDSQDMADAIISEFEASTDLAPVNGVIVTIERTEQMGAYEETPWYKTPINIHWYCYST